MMDRTTFVSRYPDLKIGSNVYSRDGENLGTLTDVGEDSLTIQKGWFFPKDFLIRFDDVQDFRDGSLYLNLAKEELSPWRDESYAGWSQVEGVNTGRMNAEPLPEYRDRYKGYGDRFGAGVRKEETRVPIVEEELEAQKTTRQAGELKIRKLVHTELRHFTVPVTREEVRVERVPVSGERAAEAGAAGEAFQEKTINIPLTEEEVTVSKRPVVREEVRVSKEQTTENREVQGEVRKEEVQVEGEEALRGRKKTA